ncbi:MAG TPA: SRPBCC family protein [Micromonosporaceae bacterium]|nr:SRPBCC family protein [Micromonosporaceae bacterium]
MTAEVAERVTVVAPAGEVFAAVADVRRMARWSPECFAVWVWRRRDGLPHSFVGWNRRGPFVWFTTCRVAVAAPGEEFAFDVTTFGQPVARWGYRFAKGARGAAADGAGAEAGGTEVTEVTEYWQDRRNRAATLLGRIFTGTPKGGRPEANRQGMRETLTRLKRELESRS